MAIGKWFCPGLCIVLYVHSHLVVTAFSHRHCTRRVRSQFQFPDCYLPPMDTSLLLSSASFLMSHNAATGYIKKGGLNPSGLTWSYSKNQIGSVYQQLDDGARALDLRPKLLADGTTLIFQHGDINIPVLFETLVEDAVRWCGDNPDELVLLLPSNFAYQQQNMAAAAAATADDYYYNYNVGRNADDFYAQDDAPAIVSAMASVYEKYSIPYYHCNEVYGMTIGEIMQVAALPTGGYLLAMDGQDFHGTPCTKPNWVPNQLVSCYSNSQNKTISCTSRWNRDVKLQALKEYMLASANNEATDSNSMLGPPANLYKYPLNEIQALWQVTTASAVTGVSRMSSILDDNRKSNLNEELVSMIYESEFDAISVLAVDNVALNGNAILSVMRTSCGQSLPSNNQNTLEDCGQLLPKPQLSFFFFGFPSFSLSCWRLLTPWW